MQNRPIAEMMHTVPRGWVILGFAAASWLAALLLWQLLIILVPMLLG
ncbi:hypothetical protein [Devosia rhizoryzae]|uniref:AI-2E family transporter n=1 Tax=Devosia rhizoryzae TaxID=2774137 RepID=A0ABX7CB06_9HYPH|nr:hypothetical protein [Devosia rhizoryzae]QQR40389.1 hypothetical protein JI748_05125 [Devosia rhizoryzae]